jgi:thymidylate synthase (FAD)
MVTFVEPSVHLIGETKVVDEGMQQALAVLGAHGWNTNAKSGSEKLIEFGGRLCYMSFNEKLNPNVTRTREGNEPYIDNVMKSGHGSVLEHAVVNFACLNVSPVFTHELVRHRAGTAFSQLSGRFVRIDDLHFWWPNQFNPDLTYDLDQDQALKLKDQATELLKSMEDFQNSATEILGLDKREGEDDADYAKRMPFSVKKRFTSAMRRLAPYGVRTHIMFSANHRAIRNIITQRINSHAEEEIDLVFSQIGDHVKSRYPALYQDMEHDEYGRWTLAYKKV